MHALYLEKSRFYYDKIKEYSDFSKIKEDLDRDAFYDLVKRHNLEFTVTTITELPTHHDSTQLYDPTLNAKQIDKWIKRVLK